MVVLKPNVVKGGRAIGLGNNLYLMKGKTHSKGGIDIGKNPKTGLEVENNEVMQVSPQGVRVFSAQPILGGISPAQYILGGANPNQVFNAQEQWKKVNRINDDGTKYRRGGKIDKKRFKTILNDKNEKEFVNWYKNVSSILGLNENPDNPNHHYDYRGYWLENKNNNIDYNVEGFHFPDTYKQPTHPTFSIESQYANKRYGINPKEVGHWEGETFIPGFYNNIINFRYKNDLERKREYLDQEYTPSEDIINYIKGIEGFRSEWYKDGNGIDTIGYGFTGKDAKTKFAKGITKEQADKYFADTLAQKVKILKRDTPNWDKLNQNQRDALLSYHYNIGEGSYRNKSPKMQQALKDEDWETVVANMDYGYNDKKNPGLKKRRDYERNLFNTPVQYKYGGIHIKPSKRGTFTAAAKKHGMSVQGFASKVLANKGKYSSAMVKKANFARNASKWKHKEFGGDMDFNYWITKDNIYKLGGRKKGQWGLKDYSNSFKVNLDPSVVIAPTNKTSISGMSLGIPNIINAGFNFAGNIGSYFVNRSALKSMQPPVAHSTPTPLRAENLETRVSTAAQEAALRENIAKQENLIAGNLSSSRSRLNAVNAVRNQGIGLYNQLQERKQNVQTELINRAKLNRQQINSQNTLLANQYKDKVTNWKNSVIDFENKRKDALSENAIQHLIQGPIDAIAGERGFFANLQNNDRYKMTAFLQAITSPDALKAMNSNEIRQLAQKFGVRTSWLRSIGINV